MYVEVQSLSKVMLINDAKPIRRRSVFEECFGFIDLMPTDLKVFNDASRRLAMQDFVFAVLVFPFQLRLREQALLHECGTRRSAVHVSADFQ
jgi:hypothetical protein